MIDINKLFVLFGKRKKTIKKVKGLTHMVQFHSESELKELYGFDKNDELIKMMSTQIKEELEQ